jgi:hypothetical protein
MLRFYLIMMLMSACTAGSQSGSNPGPEGDEVGDTDAVSVRSDKASATEQAKAKAGSKPGDKVTPTGQRPGGGQPINNNPPNGGQPINNPPPGNQPPPGGNQPPPGPNPVVINPPPPVGGPGWFDPKPVPEQGRIDAGGQCRISTANAGGLGLGLTTGASDYVPPTVVVRLKVKGAKITDFSACMKSHNDEDYCKQFARKEDQSRNCVGVLGVQKYSGVKLSNAGVSAGTKTKVDLYFPRISLAKHCAITDEATITALSFVNPDNARERVDYAVNADNSLRFANKDVWFIDYRGLSQATPAPESADPCGEAAKRDNRNVPCFTTKSDRVNIIMTAERDLLTKFKTTNGTVAIDNYPADQFYNDHQGVLVRSLAKIHAGNAWNWSDKFSSKKVKLVDELELTKESDVELNCLLKPYKTQAEVFACWNKTLKRIQATKLVRTSNDATPSVELVRNLGTNPPETWEKYIEIFGHEENGEYKVDSVGLKVNPGYRFGHSGTILIGEFIEANLTTSVSIKSAKRILGSLSTVAGKPVCTGDDLQCCEKVD